MMHGMNCTIATAGRPLIYPRECHDTMTRDMQLSPINAWKLTKSVHVCRARKEQLLGFTPAHTILSFLPPFRSPRAHDLLTVPPPDPSVEQNLTRLTYQYSTTSPAFAFPNLPSSLSFIKASFALIVIFRPYAGPMPDGGIPAIFVMSARSQKTPANDCGDAASFMEWKSSFVYAAPVTIATGLDDEGVNNGGMLATPSAGLKMMC